MKLSILLAGAAALFLAGPVLTPVVSLIAPAIAAQMSAEEFVTMASAANRFEIESSELALQKGQNGQVKSFAQHMIDDHTAAGQKMKQVASEAGLSPPDKLDDRHQALMDQLSAASGNEFDTLYVKMQVQAHEEAVNLFGNYAKAGDDAALRSFAEQTLPKLEEHRQKIKGISAEQS
jgi:putative membrane protein